MIHPIDSNVLDFIQNQHNNKTHLPISIIIIIIIIIMIAVSLLYIFAFWLYTKGVKASQQIQNNETTQNID